MHLLEQGSLLAQGALLELCSALALSALLPALQSLTGRLFLSFTPDPIELWLELELVLADVPALDETSEEPEATLLDEPSITPGLSTSSPNC